MSSILSVSQINTYISLKIKNDAKLRGVAVRGEISDLSRSRAGHIYFTLGDGSSSVRAVMFAGNASKLRAEISSGMTVIAYGNIEVYERGGTYQLVATQLIPEGAGNAFLALNILKQKLADMGVFSAPKKPIPRYPRKIAVVTSPDGAAIHDVASTVARRYPLAETVLFPATVQGTDAPASICAAIRSADASGSDVIIVTRGGGSSDDLSAFNTEAVVLEVYSCKTPVISAVGHEIDWSLCDLAADLRAPTPTGAAELATPDAAEMKAEIAALRMTVKGLAASRLRTMREGLRKYEYALAAMSVKEKIKSRRAELINLRDRAQRQYRHRLEVSHLGLTSLRAMLESLDPKNVISRGYALVMKDGEIAANINSLSLGDSVEIVMRGGTAGAEVKRISGDSDEV